MALLRIFVGEDDRWRGGSLMDAIVASLRTAGFGGATVLKAIEGFGTSGRLRCARAADLAPSLPVVIEVLEREETIRTFIPALATMIASGMLTLETVQVVSPLEHT